MNPGSLTSAMSFTEALFNTIEQRIEQDDKLDDDSKGNFKATTVQIRKEVFKEYPPEDSKARPAVVGLQQKFEEALEILNQSGTQLQPADKPLSEWKITAIFVTPKPVTPLCTDPEKNETITTAVTEDMLNDPARLNTVTGRQRTVRALLNPSNNNITLYGFYPESGLLGRTEPQQQVYKTFQELGAQKKVAFVDGPMKYMEKLDKPQVGAIYILQPPGTFEAKDTKPDSTPVSEDSSANASTGLLNPLAVVESELNHLSETDRKKTIDNLREQVHVTAIRAAQAADADDPNPVEFAIWFGPLSNEKVKARFDEQLQTINLGINPPHDSQ